MAKETKAKQAAVKAETKKKVRDAARGLLLAAREVQQPPGCLNELFPRSPQVAASSDDDSSSEDESEDEAPAKKPAVKVSHGARHAWQLGTCSLLCWHKCRIRQQSWALQYRSFMHDGPRL